DYFDDYANRFTMQQVSEKSYLPANKVLLGLMKKYGQKFRVSFSISGTALDQMEQYAPEVLESFQELAATGSVEFLAETYSHSLASLISPREFASQVAAHSKRIESLFGQKPTSFRNTELIYSDQIGQMVYDMGYKIMLSEGAKHILGWKSPNFMYCSATTPKLKLLMRNFQLSDDIAVRFSERRWSQWPLTAEKFLGWFNAMNPKEEVVNLFMDYETFGEHQWEESGIFKFLKAFPKLIIQHSEFTFKTPNELSEVLQPVSGVHIPYPISWADEERDITAWQGNEMQQEAFEKLFSIEEKVRSCEDEELLGQWRYLQTSDHFYFINTKWFSDNMVLRYMNPYNSPYDAFINFMNVLSDFMIRVDKAAAKLPEKKPAKAKSSGTTTRKKSSVKERSSR
ncbi:MAG: glycoside hydrolase family 57 protein, partial [Bacteroidales bacterium]